VHGQRTEYPNHLPLISHEGSQFILKDIIPGDLDYILSLQKHVEHSPHIRTAVDSIPERHILVFPYLEKGLLHVDIAALSSTAKKAIIRDALAGLADLHDQHIIHTGQSLSYRIVARMLTWFTDIKPTNIMMDSFKRNNGDLAWRNVQITDLEAAVVLPPKAKGLTDRLSGNHFWRSPEAWARGIQNTPSDIYSFAIVVSSYRELKTQHTSADWLVPRRYLRGQGGWCSFQTRRTVLRPSSRRT
jgi:serine/threonine protein kinase